MDAQKFWVQVAAYNDATWFAQAVMILAALYLTGRVVARPGAKTDVGMKAFLAFAFAWNGIVFFLLFVRNPISMVVGTPLFLVVSVLFVLDIFAGRTRFALPAGKGARTMMLAWILLAFLYPFVGWPLGHVYPGVLLPFFPCPLTVFAIALVAAAPRVDPKVVVALLPWALLGLPKCFGVLDCYEDCILFFAGVYGVVAFVRYLRVARQLDTAPAQPYG